MVRRWVVLPVLALLLLAGAAYLWFDKDEDSIAARAKGALRRNRKDGAVRVEVVHPCRAEMERKTSQPGTVFGYESADIYAEVSGVLRTLKVNLGSPVKEGDLLAEIAVPEIRQQHLRAEALTAQARARVKQVKASVGKAEADLVAARAAVPQARAMQAAAVATRRYREKAHKRITSLYQQGGVEERLVDESEERRLSSLASEQAGAAGVDTAKALEAAAIAKVQQADADVLEAEASVKVHQAEADRIGVLIEFASIRSPYNGVITRRNLYPGSFVRSAREGGTLPLFSIDRTDKVRVVVQIPDRDVPYADAGDPATIEVDNLAHKEFKGAISRTQSAEDPATRTMRVEIDLDNPKGDLKPGTFARVTILLQKSANVITVPAGCLVGDSREGKCAVYVVRGGKAVLVPVELGVDNGTLVEVRKGLTETDDVILRHSGPLKNGSAVSVGDAVALK